MKPFAFVLLGILVMSALSRGAEEKGIIGRSYEEGNPVIYKLVDELPPVATRDQLRWLTVISWKYDGSKTNGMPLPAVNQRMIDLETAIESHLEREGFLRHAYSRTGHNLKELVYYIHDRDSFTLELNKALDGREHYPIEIVFYDDVNWDDFKRLLGRFAKSG
jgi:hypothetical protein